MKLTSQQVYPADHSLAKMMSRLLLTLHLNPCFRATLKREWVSSIQIIYTETVGFEGREYFLSVGSLQDMAQHVANWLSSVLMDAPSPNNLTKEAITELQVEALSKCEIASAVRAQYGKGFIAGQPVPGFLEEAGEQYRTETFFAAKVFSNTEKWFGVPIYLMSGKRVGQTKQTKVVIEFHSLSPLGSTKITFDVVKNKVEMPFILKTPGAGFELESVLGGINLTPSVDGHTRLLLDAMRGDKSLASSPDFGVETWRLITPIVEAWKQDTFSPIPQYEAGGMPAEALALIRNDDREWFI
jgi:glucose-6-phosphate 1-dehydrogenase